MKALLQSSRRWLALAALLTCVGHVGAQDAKKDDKNPGKRGIMELLQPREKFQRGPGRFGAPAPNRLGVRLQTPDDTLIAQLGLAEGNGMVLAEVPETSVAAKAGFKASDILLKFDGKDVSSTLIEFTTALNAIKTDTPVDAVVLRMGKEEMIKGIKLPDVPADARPNPFPRRIQFNLRPAAPKQ
jgi:hypothetical protein